MSRNLNQNILYKNLFSIKRNLKIKKILVVRDSTGVYIYTHTYKHFNKTVN